MKIRNALKKDVSEIIELTRLLGYSVDESSFLHHYDRMLEKTEHAIFVAEDADKVVAYIHVLPKELLISIASAEIGELIVDERYRGRGIGKQLVSQAGKWAAQKGCKNLIVGSSTKRTESHLFYQGIGFEFWKEQKVYSKKLES